MRLKTKSQLRMICNYFGSRPGCPVRGLNHRSCGGIDTLRQRRERAAVHVLLGHRWITGYGVARYERLQNADFAAADPYFQRTKSFWDQVHDAEAPAKGAAQ